MEWTYESVEHARDAVGMLLEHLGLEAYLFGVEPRNGGWEVRLEYAVETGWATRVLEIDNATLVLSLTDQAARSKLLRAWSLAVRNAKRSPGARAPV